MRIVQSILIIALLSAIAQMLLPWWSVAIVAFGTTAILSTEPAKGFLAGMGGTGLWWLLAILWRDVPNHQILSVRMAELFHLPGTIWFIVVSVLVGALTGGLAGAAGALMNRQR